MSENRSAKAQQPARKEIPDGRAECFVAIPGRVSNGEGRKCEAGERVVGPVRSVNDLEARGLAFRSVDEAKAAFTSHKRKKEAEREAKIESLKKREKNRTAWARIEEEAGREESEWRA